MLRRDGSPVSATTTLREQTNPHQLLGDLAARYHDAVTAGAENLIGATGMDKIDAHAEALLTGLTDAPAWPTLRSHLALIALDEHSPLKLLTARRRASVRWPTHATPPRCSTPASTTWLPSSPQPAARRGTPPRRRRAAAVAARHPRPAGRGPRLGSVRGRLPPARP